MAIITLPAGVEYLGADLVDFKLQVKYTAAKGKTRKTISLPEGTELRTEGGTPIKNLRFFKTRCTPEERFQKDFEGIVTISGSVFKPDGGLASLKLKSVTVIE